MPCIIPFFWVWAVSVNMMDGTVMMRLHYRERRRDFADIIDCALIKNVMGLSWPGSSESACQCREYWFDPWSEKILHAMRQLSLLAATIEAHKP